MNTQEIMHQIDIQLRTLMHIRAMFPTMGSNMIGQTNAIPPPFYQMHGFRIELRFEKPLTDEQINVMNNIGRWVNQSFIIRLCALLESYHIIPPKGHGHINKQFDGHEAIDIIRRLRDVFAHTSGRYNPNKRRENKLYRRIIESYSINAEDPSTASEFSVPIDTLNRKL